MTQYTDEEIQQSMKSTENVHTSGLNFKDVDRLYWAASKYLEAKKVLGFYADVVNHTTVYHGTPSNYAVCEAIIKTDMGQRARDFLKGE